MGNLAIAYSMKKKKMADGGEVKEKDKGPILDPRGVQSLADAFNKPIKKAHGGEVKGVHKSSMEIDRPSKHSKKPKIEKKWAGESKAGDLLGSDDIRAGGKERAIEQHHKVLGELKSMKKPDLRGMADGGEVPEMDDDDLVMRIMKKRYSEGGMVANDTGEGQSADEMPNQFDDLVLRDDLESTYGDDDNSGDMLGNEQEDEDRKDIVSRIMKSQKKKDKNPRPA